jgi:hypothetical protein
MDREAHHRLRGYSGGCFWGAVLSVGIVIVSVLIASHASRKRHEDKLTARFHEATPNARIKVLERHDSDIDPNDFISGSSATILFFQSDDTTMKAFRKRWKFRRLGERRGVDSLQGMSDRNKMELGRGRHRLLLNKNLPRYACDPSREEFRNTEFVWDSKTGTGYFYQYVPPAPFLD